jgi:hypothetical protein
VLKLTGTITFSVDFFLLPVKRPSSLLLQISTGYLQLGQNAGIGKKSSLLGVQDHPEMLGGCLIDFFLYSSKLDFDTDIKVTTDN